MDLITASRLGDLQSAERFLGESPSSINASSNKDGKTALHTAAMWGQAAVVDLLLANDADIKARDSSGRTPLHAMAEVCTMIDIMQRLLDKGAEIDAKDVHGNSVLFRTAESIHEEAGTDWGFHHGAAEFLIEAGASLDVRTAIIFNDTDRLETLLGTDPDTINTGQKGGGLPDGTTPLHHACDRGNRLAVETLLRCGADMNAVDVRGRPPHYLAAHDAGTRKQQSGTDIVKLFIEHGLPRDIFVVALVGETPEMVDLLTRHADLVQARDKGENTPLHLAAWNGKIETVKLLLEAGADPNALNARGEAPVERATTYRHREVVQVLLDAGAQCDIFTAVALGHIQQIEARLKENASLAYARNRYGETPLSWAIWTDIRGLQANAKEVRQFLFDQGAKLDIASAVSLDNKRVVRELLEREPKLLYENNAAVHAAAASGNVEMLELLIGFDAPLEGKDGACRRTPLSEAAIRGHVDVVALLVDSGAAINTRDNYGDSPLVRVAEAGGVKMVELLLTKGADPNQPDYLGGTPLHWASMEGHKPVVEILLKYGADANVKGWGWWNKDKTPRDLSIQHNREEIATLFEPPRHGS